MQVNPEDQRKLDYIRKQLRLMDKGKRPDDERSFLQGVKKEIERRYEPRDKA